MAKVSYIHKNKWPWGVTWHFIVNGGQCIGTASAEEAYPGVIYISGLSTVENSRRKGLATFLLNRVEELAAAEGASWISLFVDEGYTDNIRFYENRGFVRRSTEDGFVKMIKHV